MFDVFGINKTNANEAIREIMTGATRGLLEGFEWRIAEKDSTIESQIKKIQKLENEKELIELEKNGLQRENNQLKLDIEELKSKNQKIKTSKVKKKNVK